MFFQDGLTGSAWGDWANYTDSPLRALTPAQVSATLCFLVSMGSSSIAVRQEGNWCKDLMCPREECIFTIRSKFPSFKEPQALGIFFCISKNILLLFLEERLQRDTVTLRLRKECIAGTGGPFPENYWDPAGITSKKSKEDCRQLSVFLRPFLTFFFLGWLGFYSNDLG